MAIRITERQTNKNGAWIEIWASQHSSNFYHVYYVKHWAPDFAPDIDFAESAPNHDQRRAERFARNWLRAR